MHCVVSMSSEKEKIIPFSLSQKNATKKAYKKLLLLWVTQLMMSFYFPNLSFHSYLQIMSHQKILLEKMNYKNWSFVLFTLESAEEILCQTKPQTNNITLFVFFMRITKVLTWWRVSLSSVIFLNPRNLVYLRSRKYRKMRSPPHHLQEMLLRITSWN